MIDPGAVVTAEDAERDFSRVARLAEEKGRVCVFRNGWPKLLVIDLDTEPQVEMSEDEKFLAVTVLTEKSRKCEVFGEMRSLRLDC